MAFFGGSIENAVVVPNLDDFKAGLETKSGRRITEEEASAALTATPEDYSGMDYAAYSKTIPEYLKLNGFDA